MLTSIRDIVADKEQVKGMRAERQQALAVHANNFNLFGCFGAVSEAEITQDDFTKHTAKIKAAGNSLQRTIGIAHRVILNGLNN